ncbi:MAG: acyl-CoA dehydrogenase family protein [Acidimicrobiales bacterium]
MTEDEASDARGERLLDQVAEVAESVLWPAAQRVDQADAIPRGHFEALAGTGAFGLAAPRPLGGCGVGRVTAGAVFRRLGGACGATAFSFAQHHGVVGALVTTPNEALRRRWLGPLCRGTLAGTAYAHVRRPGAGPLRATRRPGGWRFDGVAPWVTSWGRAEVFSVAAVSADGELVWALLPTDAGMVPSDPLDLVVFGATGSVRLELAGSDVADAAVLVVDDLARWRVGDRPMAARPNPMALGIGDRAIALVAATDPEVAAVLEVDQEDLAARAERATGGIGTAVPEDGDALVGTLAALRAEVVLAAQRLAAGAMAAAGGRGAELAHPAQRLGREALFYVIQAQSGEGRLATLAAVADARGPG